MSHQFSSVIQLCPTVCDPMDWSIPGFPVHHQLLELVQIHVIELVMSPTISSSVFPFSSCLQSFPASRSFPMSQFFASGGQSIGVSASASVLPINIQDCFPNLILCLLGYFNLAQLLFLMILTYQRDCHISNT